MLKKFSALLRLGLALAASYSFVTFTISNYTFQTYKSLTAGGKSGIVTVFILITNFTLYMLFNSYRELKNKEVKYKAMYIVVLIMAIIMLASIAPSWEFNKSAKFIIVMLLCILEVYFLVADFITFFLKPKRLNREVSSIEH